MLRYFIIVLLSCLLCKVHGQEETRTRTLRESQAMQGWMSGKVIDRRTGEALAGVLLRLGKAGVYTDGRGEFRVAYEKPGDTLIASLVGYRTVKLLIMRPGEVMVSLEPFESELGAVEIVEEVDRATEVAVAIERLRSLEFGESYTAERIMKQTTDFYVPNVLRRLPGVSLLSGRWVSLRGLGERYNAFAFWAAYPTWLRYDGSMPAVNELVSTLLGRVEVRKVWTPELLGHFGGGMLDFQLPEGGEEGLSIALTGEIGSWGVGQQYPVVRGSWASWENRDLPDAALIQASAPNGRPTMDNFGYARQYRRLIVPDTGGSAPPGPLLTLSYNGRKGRWQGAIRLIYGQRFNRERIDFGNGQFVFDSSAREWSYNQTLFAKAEKVWRLSQSIGVSGSISYCLSDRQILSFSYLGAMQKLQQHALEVGRWLYESIQDSQVYTWYWYPTYMLEDNRIGMGRLRWSRQGDRFSLHVETGFIGQHYRIPTMAAMNYAIYPSDAGWTYDMGIIGDYEAFGLSWHSRSTALQGYAHPYVDHAWGNHSKWLKLRGGLWYSWEGHRSNSRVLALMPDTTQSSIFTPEIVALSNMQNIYHPSHMVPGGFWLLDRTGPYNNWNGYTQISAAYFTLRAGVGRWEGMVGSRYEAYDRLLRSSPPGEPPNQTFLREQTADILPCLILKYKTGDWSHLRAAGYRTLIRPPVASQIPLNFFGYVYAHFWSGDTLYRTGHAWNIDLRWEHVKGPFQLFAVGVFYKALYDLPEVYLEPSSITTVLVYKTRNRPYGEVAGVELEARRVLWGDVTKPKIWGYLNFTLSESGARFWRSFRDPFNERLPGQSPYVINAGLIGLPAERWEIGTFFNYTGPQIWIIGFDKNVYPNVIEGGRAFWEAQVSRRLKRWEVRLSIWDILNQPYRRIQRVGNQARVSASQQAIRSSQQEEWRFYLTVRYRVF